MKNVASTHSLPNISHAPDTRMGDTTLLATAKHKPASSQPANDHPRPFSSVRTVLNPWMGTQRTYPISSVRTVLNPWMGTQRTYPFSSVRTMVNPWLGWPPHSGNGFFYT
jgi:hypothetical protein